MSKARPHALLIVAAADRDKANAALAEAGYGPDNFSEAQVAQAADSKTGTATAYACGCPPYMADEFQELLTKAGVTVKRHDGDLRTAEWVKPLALREKVKPKEREQRV